MQILSLSVLPLIFSQLTIALLFRAIRWNIPIIGYPAFFVMIAFLALRSVAWFVAPYSIITDLWTWFPIVQLLVVQESLWQTAPWILELEARPYIYTFCWAVGAFFSFLVADYGWHCRIEMAMTMALVASLLLLLVTGGHHLTSDRFIWHQTFLIMYTAACMMPNLIPNWFDSTALTQMIQIVSLVGFHWNLEVFEQFSPRYPSFRSYAPSRKSFVLPVRVATQHD